jgi:uncharacterized membrane protein
MATATLVEAPPVVVSSQTARPRLDSVDFLRGLVMVIMALDHVRDFFNIDARFFDPSDLTRTTPLLFFTRWITHFCAPTFVFLAGTGAYLWASRGRTKAELSRFLVSRGLWLIVVELTLVTVGWTYNFTWSFVGLQVIWVIGWSMILLAGLAWLPLRVIAGIGIILIAGHNLFDGIHPHPLLAAVPATGGAPNPFGKGPIAGVLSPDATPWDWLWSFLHVFNPPVAYPLIPWVGVMAAGYAFGSVMKRTPEERRRICLRLGLGLTVGFVLIRWLNVYGDPAPWASQPDPVYTVLSFLNTSKYPPSLLYLLMTLGPAIALLGLMDRASGPVVRFFVVYGRVPFLYYVAHLYLIHGLTLVAAAVTGQAAPGDLRVFFLFYPKTFGFSLGVVYVIWVAVVLALYPLCWWFARLKARRRDAWLSYV